MCTVLQFNYLNSAFFQKRRKKSGGELYTVKLFELCIFQERKKAISC